MYPDILKSTESKQKIKMDGFAEKTNVDNIEKFMDFVKKTT